jgi:iron complex outermembrane recepter protein
MTKYQLATLALAAVIAVPAWAQTAPSDAQASSTAAPAPAASEVVQLSPFDVAAQEVHGYTSAESVTGTRIASKLIDLPFAVDVVTNAFMNDFAAYNLNDQLAYVSGFSPSEVTGQFQLRGFASPITMVDGFRRIGLVGTVDIDRIEVIKGSAASIYGAITPGGAVNIITKQPTMTPEQSLDFGAGSDSFYRATLSSSGPVGNSRTLFYRVDLEDSFNKYSQEFASKHASSVAVKFEYKPDDATTVMLSLEHDELYEHPFVQALTVTEKRTMPWAGNAITESQYYGMALVPQGLLNYNYAGPESYDHNRVSSATVSVEHRFSDVWSVKFGANDFTNPYNAQSVGSGAYYPYGTGNVTLDANGNVQQTFAPEVKDQPQATWSPQQGGGYQLDNLFSFKTGSVSHKLLFTTDYYGLAQRNQNLVPTVTTSGGTSQATDYYGLYSPYTPPSYYTSAVTWAPYMGYGWNTTLYGADPAVYNATTTDQRTFAGDYGLFGSERASMLGDRLILMAGGRWDWVHNDVANYNIPAVGNPASLVLSEPANYQSFSYNTSAWTYQLGASLKVLPDVNLYANKSSAFNPQPQINSFTGLPLPNNKSDGYEFGFKTALLNERLAISVDRFVINEYNLVQNETDPVTGQKDTILSGEQEAKGYELDFNYQATNNLQFFGDWGYTQTEVLQSDTITFLNGLPARRVPRDNVGVGLRYQISHGALKGLYFVGGGKYYSKSLVNLGSGKSLIPGPNGTKSGSTSTMYYVAATNTTYAYANSADPKITGEQKISGTPVINAPFPGNGVLPYPNQPANELVDFPMSSTGTPLPLVNPSVPGVYQGMPEGVFVDDGRQNNFNAPYAVFQVGMGYEWKWKQFGNKIQVNVQNLLNRQYTYGSGTPGAPFQVVGTYSLKF